MVRAEHLAMGVVHTLVEVILQGGGELIYMHQRAQR